MFRQMTSVVSLTLHGTYSERQQQRDISVIFHNYSEDPVFLLGEKKNKFCFNRNNAELTRQHVLKALLIK